MRDLHSKIDDFEQSSHMKNIRILGVPEENGENIYNIVEMMGKHISITTESTMIDFTHRVQISKASNNQKTKNLIV